MNKRGFISVILMLLMPMGIYILTGANAANDERAEVVFGPTDKSGAGFAQATADAKMHYDKIRAARQAKDERRYDEAIKIYNDAIPSAEFKPERAVIYRALADIYFEQGDLMNERKHRLLLAEYTGNENAKRAAVSRAEDLRRLLKKS